MEYLKLIGILIVIVGFALKLDSILIIVSAAIVTALAVSYTHLFYFDVDNTAVL